MNDWRGCQGCVWGGGLAIAICDTESADASAPTSLGNASHIDQFGWSYFELMKVAELRWGIPYYWLNGPFFDKIMPEIH